LLLFAGFSCCNLVGIWLYRKQIFSKYGAACGWKAFDAGGVVGGAQELAVRVRLRLHFGACHQAFHQPQPYVYRFFPSSSCSSSLLLYPLSPFFSFQTLDLFGVLSARGGDFLVTVTIESMLLKNGSSSIRVWGPFWLLSAHTTCSSSGSHLLTCYLGLELVCLGTVRRGHRFEMIRFTVMSRLLAGFAHEDWMFALFTVDCVKALFYVFSFCLRASHLLLSNFVALLLKSWSWTYPNSLPKLGLKVDFEAASK